MTVHDKAIDHATLLAKHLDLPGPPLSREQVAAIVTYYEDAIGRRGYKWCPCDVTHDMEVAWMKSSDLYEGWRAMWTAAPDPKTDDEPEAPDWVKIEALARQLCSEDGKDPDELVDSSCSDSFPRWEGYARRAILKLIGDSK